MKRIFLLLLALSVFLCSCSKTEPNPNATQITDPPESTAVTAPAISIDPEEQFSDKDRTTAYENSVTIELDGTKASCADQGVHTEDSAVTIRSEGTFVLTGSYEGQVIIDAGEKADIHLILQNAHISNQNHAALWIKAADKIILTLEGNNSLRTEGSLPSATDSNVDATLFSKADLSLNGEGSLEVESPAHGLVCKKDLVFTGGNYSVTSAQHGISAKDSLRIAAGSFTVQTQNDGLHVENTEEADRGYLYIQEGTFLIRSQWDGISASNSMQIDGGNFDIQSGGGAENGAVHTEAFPGSWQSNQTTSTDTVSTKGIKAGGDLQIRGGTFLIDSADDGVHGEYNVFLTAGDLEIRSGDDGIHAEVLLQIHGGNTLIHKSYEGLEGHQIHIQGGTIDLTASDDGLNAAGGNDGSGFSHNDIFANDTEAYIRIDGGYLHMDASGDGIDSNGDILINGGETYVSGPTNGGNGSLDYGGEAKVTGGIFLAVGSSGMATGFGSNSTQGAIFVTYSSQPAGSEISLKNSNGEEIFSRTTEKSSGSLVLSCPGIQQGQTYDLTVGQINGEITMTNIVYGQSNGGGPGGGGPGGQPPGGQGGRPGGQGQPGGQQPPNGQQPPEGQPGGQQPPNEQPAG